MTPKHNDAFLAAMEDVLEVYSIPYNKIFPVVCMDEKPLQLLADARCKIKMESRKPERIDNEYIRKNILEKGHAVSSFSQNH